MVPHSLVTLLLTFIVSAASSPLPTLLHSASPLSSLSETSGDIVPQSLQPSQSRITLPVAKRFNSTGSANVVKFDQERARATRLRSQASQSPAGLAATSFAQSGKAFNAVAESQAVSYVIEVTIGNPGTMYQLLVDTGSSNTWVGAGKPYVPSSTSRTTGQPVTVTYGSGAFAGTEYIDTITLADGLTIANQSIGVAVEAEGFDGVDGILGVGPQALTCGSLPLSPEECIPTVTDNAWNMGLLDAYEIGISFHPSQYLDQKNGELTFGGVDRSKFDEPLAYVPLTTTSPASQFVGYDQSIRYGDKDVVLEKTAGILDTGTTLILLATDAFKRYQKLVGGEPDNDTGLLRITAEQYGNLQNLNFIIGDKEYALTPNAQIWPRALNEEIGGTTDGIYLIVADLQSDSGQGLDFINGMSFLERFYAVYDVGSSQIGLARTHYTEAETN
ncbi:aspartic peptidase A1 [Trametes polyzona]|nr:aspartic peptidase A1 [Trametes polyzona]